jgi:hypothetical protein
MYNQQNLIFSLRFLLNWTEDQHMGPVSGVVDQTLTVICLKVRICVCGCVSVCMYVCNHMATNSKLVDTQCNFVPFHRIHHYLKNILL